MDSITEAVVTAIKENCPKLPEVTDLDENLLEHGLDSLDYSAVMLTLEENYEIKIPDEDMLTLETVNLIAEYVRQKTA